MKGKPTGSLIKRLVRNFILEVVIYSVLVTLYYLLVLRFLSEPLLELFNNNLTVYAAVALLLILAQGVLLEQLTGFLLERLGLQRFE